ncbi:hypothetical protein SH668x_002866 [Planctomicrobium sp. SH668]|uniref:hypothetical protein n=1 Tax=Planctomicrobium sp. SH668 TaxID=3448126 RepID=UPI003F5B9DCC
MAAPIMLPLGAIGGLVGYACVHNEKTPLQLMLLMIFTIPLMMGIEKITHTPREFLVSTVVDIDAPREQVWKTVLEFPELPPPDEIFFRAGIAYPIKAEIQGHGVGAIRRCIFSTGAFVEPITVWDEPKRLAFDVAEQPHSMTELSPYPNLHPPHLDNSLRSNRGEFLLEELPGNRTRLIGNTWYELEIYPHAYWTIWTQGLIHRIHLRVLEHVKVHAEKDYASSQGAQTE